MCGQVRRGGLEICLRHGESQAPFMTHVEMSSLWLDPGRGADVNVSDGQSFGQQVPSSQLSVQCLLSHSNKTRSFHGGGVNEEMQQSPAQPVALMAVRWVGAQ